jgi:hypothetical protein
VTIANLGSSITPHVSWPLSATGQISQSLPYAGQSRDKDALLYTRPWTLSPAGVTGRYPATASSQAAQGLQDICIVPFISLGCTALCSIESSLIYVSDTILWVTTSTKLVIALAPIIECLLYDSGPLCAQFLSVYPHHLQVIYFILFYCDISVWNQGLAFSRHALYHLSHIPQPFFALLVFQIESFIFAQGQPGLLFSYLHLLFSWDCRHEQPCLSFWLWWSLANFFA